jgi:glutaredoxin
MITLYTKTPCPYCDQAKHYLKGINEDYNEINIAENEIAREWLISQGHKTVPQIYYERELLVEGGYTGLSKLSAEQIQERKRVIRESK